MIKYHGGVLHTDAIEHWEYAGRNFCVSWAQPEKVGLYHSFAQSMLLDNGAYSFWTQGRAVDWDDFYRWAQPWLEHPTTFAIIPDVMDGSDEDNDRLVREWPFDTKGWPVWHLPESLERLDRLVYQWPVVCLSISSNTFVPCPECKAPSGEPCVGDSARCKLLRPALCRINSPQWRARMADVMDVCCDGEGYPRTNLHMLRGLRFVGGPYPLYSADSASVARSWAGSPKSGDGTMKSVARYYASFDGLNPPVRWERPHQTETLFDAAPAEDPDVLDDEQLDEGLPLADPHPDMAKPAKPIVRTASNRVQTGIEGI